VSRPLTSLRLVVWLICLGLLSLGARRAAATTTTVTSAAPLTLTQDLVLSGTDVLDAEGSAGAPCTIEGNGHSITAVAGWQGNLIIRFCTLHGLGVGLVFPDAGVTAVADLPAIALQASGSAQILLEGNTFDASADLTVTAVDDVTVQILRNTVLENSLVAPSMTSADNTVNAMLFQGSANTTPKLFQGNKIFKGGVKFDSVQNWLIGGTSPGEGNVIVGIRGGIFANGSNLHIAGNYLRFSGTSLDGWNQVKPLEVEGGDILIEHNVIRDGNWLVDVLGGAEVRYNLLGDSHDRPWLILENEDGTQKIHHNVFMRNDPSANVDGVWVYHLATATTPAEIYNNTFYGGGKCFPETGPAIDVEAAALLTSLRSNAFAGFATNLGADTAMVRGGHGPPAESITPPPQRLGYADYNLFWNPQAARKDNYGLAVAGKQERVDPGFALNDALAGGKVDDQVDPMFAAGDKVPVLFPYSDDDIKSGAVTVCQILAFYRTVFAPAPGSPLIGVGDPADGAGNSIGAIGGADDNFGMLCAGGDVGAPNLTAATFTCPAITPGMPGTGGTVGPIGGKGFVCVCDVAQAPSPPVALVTAALALAGLLARRRGRRASRRRPPPAAS
jgi:hypothetical protein